MFRFLSYYYILCEKGLIRFVFALLLYFKLVMSLDEENPIRLSVYRKAVGIESAIIEKADLEGQNGVVHIINRVIIPANISAGDLLRREGNFK